MVGRSPRARSSPIELRRIGVLYGMAETDLEAQAWDASFRKRLAELGWIDGRNIRVEDRWTGGSMDRTKQFANELVRLNPDVLVAVTTPATAALQQETRTIPIIFTSVSDPVGSGFVASLPNPGGNITGFINMEASLSGKWVELIREIAPHRLAHGDLVQSANRTLCSILFGYVPIRCDGTLGRVDRGPCSQPCGN